MDEFEWLNRDNPEVMLRFLRGSVSDRKLRLLACEACRDLFGYLSRLLPQAVPETEMIWNGLHAAERFLDGQIPPSDLAAAYKLAVDYSNYKRWLEYALSSTARADAWDAADQTLMGLRDFVDELDRYATPDQTQEIDSMGFWDGSRQVAFIRDIFGNPFRPVAFDPAWLTSDATLLAQGIYDERAFDRMPILADALQDAGCTNEDILNHCRDASATHVRGCWVVDLVLGKQ
jgi:hypothetical protein